jgi:hypothetical protein
MILPLLGFFAGIFISSIAGLIVLIIHPKWKVTLSNVIAFMIGSFIVVIITGILYGIVFANSSGTLTSTKSVIGLFISIAVAVFVGGIAGIVFSNKFVSKNEN